MLVILVGLVISFDVHFILVVIQSLLPVLVQLVVCSILILTAITRHLILVILLPIVIIKDFVLLPPVVIKDFILLLPIIEDFVLLPPVVIKDFILLLPIIEDFVLLVELLFLYFLPVIMLLVGFVFLIIPLQTHQTHQIHQIHQTHHLHLTINPTSSHGHLLPMFVLYQLHLVVVRDQLRYIHMAVGCIATCMGFFVYRKHSNRY